VRSEHGSVSTAVRRLVLAGAAAVLTAGTAAALRARKRRAAPPPIRPVSPPATTAAQPVRVTPPPPSAPTASPPASAAEDAAPVPVLPPARETPLAAEPDLDTVERPMTERPAAEPAHGESARAEAAPAERPATALSSEAETSPGDIPGTGRVAVLKRTVKEFQEDNITDWAAALTYYAVLSLFPAALVLVALLGLLGQYPETTNALLDIVRQVSGDNSALDGLEDTINDIVRNRGGAGALLGVGLLGALWSASGYTGAFMRASNEIYEISEGRPFWKLRPLQVVVTLSMVLLLAVVAISLVVTGPVAEAIGDQVGLGAEAVTAYEIAKWPLMGLIFLFMLAVLYYVAPNAQLPRFRWITPGALVALLGWALVSLAFGFYVANFGSYNKTYGTLGGAISLLVWLWISNIAVLFGQELNAEVERGRELSAGLPAAREIQLPPRDAPKEELEDAGEEISREARFRPNRAEQASGG
jgi:membrane protein